jgi:hypothetical protein
MTPLVKEAQKRLSAARADKDRQQRWMRSAYRHLLPYRRRFDDSANSPEDQDDLFDATGQEAIADFAAEITHTFTPAEVPWVDHEIVASEVSEAEKRRITDIAKKVRNTVFGLIRESNLFEALPEAHLDLGVGTCAAIADDLGTGPVRCRAVAASDLWIERGPWGTVGARMYRTMMTPEAILATWEGVALPPRMRGPNNAQKEFEVWCGWWRDWSRRDDEVWQHVIWSDSDQIASEVRVGEGGCSINVARWSVDSSSGWGFGPAYAAMANVRMLDELAFLNLRGLEKRVDPPLFYDDDSVINIDNGMEPGMAYARATGSQVDFLEPANDLNAGFFERTQLEMRVRRAFYQDDPVQLGKTPPTAAQWLDQAQRTARRMGSPVGRIVTEWQLPWFKRFAYIARSRGLIKPEEWALVSRTAKATSPLMRAQRQDEALVSVQFLQLVGGIWGPEMLKLLVNGGETVAKMKDMMQADGVVLNDPEEVAKWIAGMAERATLDQRASGMQNAVQ